MTTLIAVYDNDGCRGRCDARCYEAKEPECDCICGGRNHGAGLARAIENTNELAEKWIEQYSKDNQLDPKKSRWEISSREMYVQESLI